MKCIVKSFKTAALLVSLAAGFSACNKENLATAKMMQVVISGYNGTAHSLQVDIDTTAYGPTVNNGAYIYKPGALITFNIAYTYADNGQERIVTLKDPETGKVVFSKPLPATGTAIGYQFIYSDGKELEITRPAADATTNKLGFYVRYAESNEPFDIHIYRKDLNTGKEYRHALAKNAVPGTWVYTNFVDVEGFDTELAWRESTMYFTKPGTTDQWAFRDSETMSKFGGMSMSLPIAGEKGLVLPYFITPGTWDLSRVNLFYDKNRRW